MVIVMVINMIIMVIIAGFIPCLCHSLIPGQRQRFSFENSSSCQPDHYDDDDDGNHDDDDVNDDNSSSCQPDQYNLGIINNPTNMMTGLHV